MTKKETKQQIEDLKEQVKTLESEYDKMWIDQSNKEGAYRHVRQQKINAEVKDLIDFDVDISTELDIVSRSKEVCYGLTCKIGGLSINIDSARRIINLGNMCKSNLAPELSRKSYNTNVLRLAIELFENDKHLITEVLKQLLVDTEAEYDLIHEENLKEKKIAMNKIDTLKGQIKELENILA